MLPAVNRRTSSGVVCWWRWSQASKAGDGDAIATIRAAQKQKWSNDPAVLEAMASLQEEKVTSAPIVNDIVSNMSQQRVAEELFVVMAAAESQIPEEYVAPPIGVAANEAADEWDHESPTAEVEAPTAAEGNPAAAPRRTSALGALFGAAEPQQTVVPDAPMVNERVNEWACTTCTFRNIASHLACDMCGSEKPHDKYEMEALLGGLEGVAAAAVGALSALGISQATETAAPPAFLVPSPVPEADSDGGANDFFGSAVAAVGGAVRRASRTGMEMGFGAASVVGLAPNNTESTTDSKSSPFKQLPGESFTAMLGRIQREAQEKADREHGDE